MKKIQLLAILFLLSFTTRAHEHIIMQPKLQDFLEDISLYQLDARGEPYLHAGDLLQHSVWAYNKMALLVNEESVYTKNLVLTDRTKEILCLAALLHDIGKAGRHELITQQSINANSSVSNAEKPQLNYIIVRSPLGFVNRIIYFQDWQVHPKVGFDYIARPLIPTEEQESESYYQAIDRKTAQIKPFDLNTMLNELGLTSEEQKLLAVLIGMHYEFGNLRNGFISVDAWLEKMATLVKTIGYQNCILTEEAVRLAILIHVADVGGLVPVPAQKTALFPEGISCEQTHTPIRFSDPLHEWDYDCCAADLFPAARIEEILERFKEKYYIFINPS